MDIKNKLKYFIACEGLVFLGWIFLIIMSSVIFDAIPKGEDIYKDKTVDSAQSSNNSQVIQNYQKVESKPYVLTYEDIIEFSAQEEAIKQYNERVSKVKDFIDSLIYKSYLIYWIFRFIRWAIRTLKMKQAFSDEKT